MTARRRPNPGNDATYAHAYRAIRNMLTGDGEKLLPHDMIARVGQLVELRDAVLSEGPDAWTTAEVLDHARECGTRRTVAEPTEEESAAAIARARETIDRLRASAAGVIEVDAQQQMIRPPYSIGADGTLSGPRSVVAPLARVGGRCAEIRCRLNADRACMATERHICPAGASRGEP